MSFKAIEQIAIRKAKVTGWLPCIFEWITDDTMLVKGGVPIGAKNGRPRWGPKKSLTTVAISKRDIADEEERFEKETGKCAACEGKGEVVYSFSVTEGTKYRQCDKCKGSGKAAGAEGSAA